MGTRGLYGIRKDGIDKCTYNHWDSYPDYLGRKVLNFCAKHNIKELSKLYDNIKIVYENEIPTKEQIETCKKLGYANFGVSTGSETDWYCLLRNLQGNFHAYTDCINNGNKMYMLDYADFKDSPFCEYTYIIDIDNEVLKFQDELEIPFNEINFDTIDELVNRMDMY